MNPLMAEPTTTNYLSEVFSLRGQSNGKEFRMAMSNKGKQSLVREGYMYRLDHSGKDKLSWRCSTRGCPAHLKTDRLAEVILLDNDKTHSHSADAHKFEKQILRIACKRKAVEDCSTRTQDIISNEITRLSGDLNLSPQNTKFLQLAMYRERKKAFPKIPRTSRNGGNMSKRESKINSNSESATSIPQPHISTLPTVCYAQPPSTTYEPHFDLLADDGEADYQHQNNNNHHHHDNLLQLQSQQLLQQQENSGTSPQIHQHQLVHPQLQPLESTLPQTIFPSNHTLPGPAVVASTSVRDVPSNHQLSSCSTQKVISCADICVHKNLLNDKVCILTYRRALQENRIRLKGATVLEVEAGTAILSHFAVQAGATRAYAVEPSDMAVYAEKIVQENGLGSTITVLQSQVETADIPVKVDAIICDWMGPSLLCQSKLSSLLMARDRFLKQGGDMYPCTAELFLAPITDEGFDERFKMWKQMKSMFGVSMESFGTLAKETMKARANKHHFEAESVLANACRVCRFDLRTMTVQDAHVIKADLHFKCYNQNTMHGFATWFIVAFPGTVALDTSPYGLKTQWGQTGLYLKTPVSIKQDSEIRVVFKMHPLSENHKLWQFEIEFQQSRGRKYTQQWHLDDWTEEKFENR